MRARAKQKKNAPRLDGDDKADFERDSETQVAQERVLGLPFGEAADVVDLCIRMGGQSDSESIEGGGTRANVETPGKEVSVRGTRMQRGGKDEQEMSDTVRVEGGGET